MPSEVRKDPIVDRWVIIAPGRALRPQEFQSAFRQRSSGQAGGTPADADQACPFCVGNEHHTPPAVYQRPETGAWSVRVVPNRYPAVELDPGLPVDPPAEMPAQLGAVRPGNGAHEVIIESPQHVTRTGELEAVQLREVLGAYHDRLNHWRSAAWARSALLFKNVGAAAGASLSHLHSQLIALPWVPAALRDEVESAHRYYRQHGSCAFCDLIRRELADGQRIVLSEPRWLAMAAYAPRQPFETWLLPASHGGRFEELTPTDPDELATVLRRVVHRVESVLTTVAYNMIVHSSPFDTCSSDHYHWHIEIVPRVAELAGFELGGGAFMHSVVPEEAATMLRDLRI